jgi:hypothetical protein
VNLRTEARGRDCTVRSPVCCFDPAQTVLAHVRMQGISGIGLKAPDLLGAWACAPCHSLVDTGRYLSTRMERDECDLLLLKGVMRTQAQLIKEGIVKC